MIPAMQGKKNKRVTVFLLLLAILITLIYSNTFNASWHLDDLQNIVTNPHLKLTKLNISDIKKTFYGAHDAGQYRGEKLYRPVTCLTFGLNWYVGQNNVTGYHIVNLIIHVLTAISLFSCIMLLMKTPFVKTSPYRKDAYFIAGLATVLWATNPIQTQAITYIVQRMASLSTLFYCLSLMFYVNARLEDHNIKKTVGFLICIVLFVLGILSKENAVLLPLSLILVEIIFFQNLKDPEVLKKILIFSLTGVFIILIVGAFVFLDGNLFSILKFSNREFTPYQRLLTEFRVVIFYLSQIFYPIPSRLSIDHTFFVSTSLFSPMSTLFSLLFILTLIIIAFFNVKKRPILSFSILFYFLNHTIESTILNLELVFEHRNYLPSLFIFWPFAVVVAHGINYYKEKQKVFMQYQ